MYIFLKIVPARHGEPIPDIPDPEYSILKNHLNQVLKIYIC
jgi:hypothetical protein